MLHLTLSQQQNHWLQNNIHPYHTFSKAHLNSIETLSFNPVQKSMLVSGSHDKTIKVWDLQKMENTQTLKAHTQGVWASSFSNDGKLLFTGSPDKTIIAWDLKKEKPVSILKEHINKIYWVQMSQDGNLMASGGEDGRVIIWDMKKMALLKMIQASKGIIYNTHFIDDDKYLFCCDNHNQIRIYDTKQFQLRAHIQGSGVAADTFNTDGKHHIVIGSNNSLKHFEFIPSKHSLKLEYQSYAHMDQIMTLDVQEGLIATGCRDGSARIWEMDEKDGEDRALVNLLGHKQNVSRILFFPMSKAHTNSHMAVTCSWDQDLNFYKF